jgi:hypothetical protein
MTQADRVLEYLESGKTITTLNAFNELGITRLAARVHELKSDGHEVKKNTITVVNRFNENCSIAEYYMDCDNG